MRKLIFIVPTDCYGVNVEALEKLIQQYQNKFNKIDKKHPYTALFYTIPVFNNPTSITLPSGNTVVCYDYLKFMFVIHIPLPRFIKIGTLQPILITLIEKVITIKMFWN